MTGGIFDELKDIERRLFEIPDEKVFQLTLLIERSRAISSSAEFAERTLSMMRPRLMVTRPPRNLTLQRIFCHPFEDLIVNTHGGSRRYGKVARVSLNRAWQFFTDVIDQAAIAGLDSELKQSEHPKSSEATDPRIAHFGERLWEVAAKTLTAEITRWKGNADYRTEVLARLGDENTIADLEDMTGILRVAVEIEKMKTALSPKPVGHLLDEQAEAVGKCAKAIADIEGAKAGYAVFVALARMDDKFAALPMFEELSMVPSGMGDQTLATIARSVIAGDAAEFFDNIADTQADDMKDSDIAELVENFVAMVGRIKSDPKAAPQPGIEKATQRLKEIVKKNVVESADGAILDAVSIPGKDAISSIPPDQRQEAAFDAKVQAEARAFALQKCARVAEEIGVKKEVDHKLKQLATRIEAGAWELLNSVESGKLMHLTRRDLKDSLYSNVRMMELVMHPLDASKLLKEGLKVIEQSPNPE